MMNRRTLLKSLAALPLAGQFGQLLAASSNASTNSPKFLLVFLRGAYDAANLLVPVTSDFYYQARPNIAIPKPSADLRSALALDADWGLHPALRESIYPLYQNGQAAFIPFAGTEDTSRSHFETQDSIELGQPLDASRNFRSGFLNRLAAVLNGGSPIAFTDQVPLVLQGRVEVPNIALRAVAKPSVDARQSALIAQMYKGTPLAAQVGEGFSVRDEVTLAMASEMESSGRNAITAKGFELEARRIARLMQDKHNIGFVDVGGWDTHVGQGGSTGYLAGRLDELGRGLSGFADEMGAQWKNTVVMVVSEFGRTFRENGNRGTDHGHGTVYWVLGGSIKGGRISGAQQPVTQAALFQNRDYVVLNEYRSVLAGLFGRMYGLRGDQLEQVFTQVKAVDVGLV
ncbi:MAG: tat (twin-arginine translocation) pathway signal sequence domain protein [Rhodocyclales bacterium]|nr:tat (twin-arginine translocation) pathway signal sequence domain protein [Rhodocyclales bacterium]